MISYTPIELEDHVLVYIPKPEHPEDLVPAEDEVPTPPLLPSGTPPLLPIPLPAPSTSRRADIPEADTPPREGYYLLTPPGLRDTERRMMTALEMVNMRKDRAVVRAEIEVLRRERLAYEQESMETRQALARYDFAVRISCVPCPGSWSNALTHWKDTDDALTWWNAHVKTTTLEAAHAMPWATLKKMMTDKYCPRGEIKNIETEMWNLKAEKKRKYDDLSKNNQNQQQQNKRQNTGQAYTAGNSDRKPYAGSKPLCSKCNYNHKGPCPPRAPMKVYVVGNAGANPDNVVVGTFLLNNRYAYILFDTGADRSFVSTSFSSQIDITPSTLDHYYDVELADERIIGLNTILKGCTLNFLNHKFNINLMPVELGSFDAIIGMDWLAKCQAVIVCAEKIVHIPWGNETLIIHGDGSNQGNVTRLKIISCTKTQKYMEKGLPIFLAHVTSAK
ncbi:putative reverse transcriptase domain-containing protein [Tanacetum coccineum]